VRHGAADDLARQIRQLCTELKARNQHPPSAVTASYSQAVLLPQLVTLLENTSEPNSNK